MRLHALFYFKEYTRLLDTISNDDKKKEFIQQEMNYDFEKQQILAKAEQDVKDARTTEEKEKQRLVLFFTLGGLILVVVFSVFLYKRFRLTQKQKNIIEEQKLLVEEHQKEILDSIYYAKRIQKAHLPTEKYITKSIDRLKK